MAVVVHHREVSAVLEQVALERRLPLVEQVALVLVAMEAWVQPELEEPCPRLASL